MNPKTNDLCQIGNNGRGNKKECCCVCGHQFRATVCNCFGMWPADMVFNPSPLNDRHGQIRATVCNCFGMWPADMVFNPSPLNDRHGQIGWCCTCFMHPDQGDCIEISKHQHGLCEEFHRRP